MAQKWVQTCFAQSQMDCYYFGCIKLDKCEQFKLLNSKLPLEQKENQNENTTYHND